MQKELRLSSRSQRQMRVSRGAWQTVVSGALVLAWSEACCPCLLRGLANLSSIKTVPTTNIGIYVGVPTATGAGGSLFNAVLDRG